ncbi:dTDP-4-dehydrorhamnose reductase [Fodinicola feengrottensis]|uniref:dTDP-4-dehydrorhamnose reductase n=1 Tax=Fodinicola feengrottensis TaxID=435914 RepID=A0ABN2HI01_9ACTN
MTRWLIAGGGGMLGRELEQLLAQSRLDDIVVALPHADLDITDPSEVGAAVRQNVGPGDVVVNSAAYTNVDAAEADQATAYAVNAEGPAALAGACGQVGARLVHISTDYVFDGKATRPYEEDANTGPVNAYGASKLAGERAVLMALPNGGYVVRTCWLYGRYGANFVSTVLAAGRAGKQLTLPTTQVGQPTWTRPVAEQILALVESDAMPGLYHGSASGAASRYEQAFAAFEAAGLDTSLLTPTVTPSLRPAARPSYTALAHTRWIRAGLPRWPQWRTMLDTAIRTGTFD